ELNCLATEITPMLLSEPPRTQADLLFQIGGIPVRVSPFFWLVALLLGDTSSGANFVIWIASVFISILIHELGHAVLMRRYGFAPRIVLHHMGGLAIPDQKTSGGVKSGPWTQIIISLAGPAAGLALGAIVFVLAKQQDFTWRWEPPFISARHEADHLAVVVGDLLYINVLWSIVNLFPVHPLDGGQVARELLLMHNTRQGIVRSFYLSIGTAAAVAIGFVAVGQWTAALLFFVLGALNVVNLRQFRQFGGGGGSGGGHGGGGGGGGGYGGGGYGGGGYNDSYGSGADDEGYGGHGGGGYSDRSW
ncbi:MAG: hypothetical protein QF805_17015, partial [Pirellulaceae bacterium]|nr:hypothetical protein [Pirellulaceae bacterium]